MVLVLQWWLCFIFWLGFFASAVIVHKLLFYSNKETANEICIAESLGFYLSVFLCFIFVIKAKGYVSCMQRFTEEVNDVGFTR